LKVRQRTVKERGILIGETEKRRRFGFVIWGENTDPRRMEGGGKVNWSVGWGTKGGRTQNPLTSGGGAKGGKVFVLEQRKMWTWAFWGSITKRQKGRRCQKKRLGCEISTPRAEKANARNGTAGNWSREGREKKGFTSLDGKQGRGGGVEVSRKAGRSIETQENRAKVAPPLIKIAHHFPPRNKGNLHT